MNWAACDERAVQALCTHTGLDFAKAEAFLLARQLQEEEEAGNGNLGEVGEVGEVGGATSAAAAAAAGAGAEQHGAGHSVADETAATAGGVASAAAAAAAGAGAEQHGAGHSVADETAATAGGVASAAAAAAGEGEEEDDDDDPSQFHNSYLNEAYRAHPATEHESCLKEVVLQLAHPTKPKKIHIAWNIGKQGERTSKFWQDIIDSKKPITFSCGGSWCLVRVTGFRFFEAARGAHEAALRFYQDRVTEVMPLDHTRAEVVDVAQALASYKWIYIGRLLEKASCKKTEEQLMEEFAKKEAVYGVRAIEVEIVPEMCYIQHARSFSKEARAHQKAWREAAVAAAVAGGGGAAGAGGGGGGGGDEKSGQKRRHA